MKNPFEKNNHKILIGAAVFGGIAAAAVAYLYLTENGGEAFDELKKKIKDAAKDVASGALSKKTGIAKKTVRAAADHFIK